MHRVPRDCSGPDATAVDFEIVGAAIVSPDLVVEGSLTETFITAAPIATATSDTAVMRPARVLPPADPPERVSHGLLSTNRPDASWSDGRGSHPTAVSLRPAATQDATWIAPNGPGDHTVAAATRNTLTGCTASPSQGASSRARYRSRAGFFVASRGGFDIDTGTLVLVHHTAPDRVAAPGGAPWSGRARPDGVRLELAPIAVGASRVIAQQGVGSSSQVPIRSAASATALAVSTHQASMAGPRDRMEAPVP